MSPNPPPSTAPRRAWLALVMALLALVVAASALVLLVHAARTEVGTRWLLARVPGLTASGIQGSLFGDELRIASLRWEGDATQPTLQVDGMALMRPSWRLLPFAGGWVSLAAPSLSVTRLVWHSPREPTALTAPPPLRLPLAIDIDALSIGELQVDDGAPWRDVRAALHIGSEAGSEHRVEALSLHNDRLRIRGDARLGAAAPNALTLHLQAAPLQGTPWQASIEADGPLAGFTLRAHLRSDEGRSGAPQLDALARVTPFAAWPLAALQLSTRALDLAALSSAAPHTRIDAEAEVRSSGLDRPAQASLRLRNHAPGRWDAGRLPVREMQLDLAGTPSRLDRIDIRQLEARLGDEQRDAGRLSGSGQWTASELQLQLHLSGVEPARLLGAAPVLRAGGSVSLRLTGMPLPATASAGSTAASTPTRSAPAGAAARTAPVWHLRAQAALDGTLGASARPLHAQFEAAASADTFELVRSHISAGEASVQATLNAQRLRDGSAAIWQLNGTGELHQVDPLPWWSLPADSPWARGPHRVNGRWQLDAKLPATLADQLRRQPAAALAALRGRLQIDLAGSVLAGLPLAAQADVRGDGQALAVRASASAAGNAATLDGRFAVDAAQDRWRIEAALPALAALQPWSKLAPAAPWPSAGSLSLDTQLAGRWPRLRGGSGSLQASGVHAGDDALAEGHARWRFGGDEDAPLELTLDAKGLQHGALRLDELQVGVDGTLRAQRISARAQTPARPPAWSEALVGGSGSGTRVTFDARGAWRAAPGGGGRWLADAAALHIDARNGKGSPWLDAQGLRAELVFDGHGALTQAQLSPGRASFAGGAALRWSQASWRAQGQQFDLSGEVEPLALAPLLARLQPDIGWDGDLALAGRIEVHAAQRLEADIELARTGGDLRIADESGSAQALGIGELRLAFSVHDGVWRFAQGLAGTQIGEMAGAQVVRTDARARWPGAGAPLDGVLQMHVANLGAWGVWVPPGWRLGGNLRVAAALGGRFGAPQLRGSMEGSELSVRNVLQGVGFSDGELSASLEGEVARVQRLSFKGGDGRLDLSGEAQLGAAPSAKLQLTAEHFRLLGRIDRRLVASGAAQLQLDRARLQLDGRFTVDEGLIDFSKASAPSLDSDVTVVRAAAPGNGAASSPRAPAQQTLPAPLRNAQVNLAVSLGDKLQIRGHGLDAHLRGELRLSTPSGRPALNGTVRTASGTYVAYAQRLVIERGELVFTGAPQNPRVDILAIRPNLDVRVGVAVTGTLQNVHVRLYSEPDMAEMDKLSWLLLGRASDGLGRNDTALLQRAAVALLSGEEQGPTDQLLHQLGLTDFSVRQSDSETRESIVSLGRQLSQRWYVGYERSVNATTGSWQLIYRIAQRFTVRAQAGADNALDFIWQWRW
ncbi:MAG: translocation/assembly module TamB domain-containing protein [Burkholderiaceae bacterium]